MNKAMIFAAGLGTRLYPYTQNTPKALVKIQDKTLLEIAIRKFIDIGIHDMVVNVCHFADQVINFLTENHNFGARIMISDERDNLLETGGGIKKASWFFEGTDSFFVYNVDVLSDINLSEMKDFHLAHNALVTLAIRKRETSRYLLFNENSRLCGWENLKTGEKILASDQPDLERQAFSGIHIINPEIFNLLSESGKFSIIASYLRLAKKYKIMGFNHDDSLWMDVGTPQKLQEAHAKFKID
jgi:NDP-sugar pyrophosphorylase family protein